VGGNNHKVVVCVDIASSPGTYNFTAAALTSGVAPFPWFELKTSSDPDLSGFGITQNSTGPFNAVTDNDVITTNVSVTPGNCADVFVRLNTCSSNCNIATNHPGNRLWTDANGTTNPFAGVSITATIPAGYSFLLSCINDDLANPISCTNGGYGVANIFHGTAFVYTFTAPTGNNCSYTQGYYKNHESYTASVLSGNAGTTYITAGGKLMIGAYELTAAQIDAILEAPVGKAYNQGGVVFTKDQLAMIHQLITAELNIAGGADGSSIAATITAANNNYTSATKTQLSAWTTALTNFNEGATGPGHCD
jgi:hypothetical protein